MPLQRRSRVTPSERARRRGHVAATIAARRHELDLSQGELADLAGVARGPIVSLEAGRSVSLDVLLAVLGVLGLHLELARGSTSGAITVDPGLRRHFRLDEPETEEDRRD